MPAPVTSPVWGQENWSSTLIEALSLESAVLRAGASRVLTEGRVVHIPRLLVNPDADWVAELTELPSDAGEGDSLELTPKKIANVVSLSNEAVADSPVDQLDAIGRAMVRGVATKLDARFFSATAASAIAPAGLLSYTLPATAGHAVDIAGIITAIGEIVGKGGLPDVVFLSAADLTAIRLQALTGGFILTADPQAPGIERIGGASLIATGGLAAGTCVVCEARFITLAVREDAEVAFSPDAGWTTDSVVARIKMRVDWAPSDPNAFCTIVPA